MKASKRVTTETNSFDVIDMSVNEDAMPPRCLVTKLISQNARLKNFARQLIAERGMTVAQYLVRLRVCMRLTHSCKNIFFCFYSSNALAALNKL